MIVVRFIGLLLLVAALVILGRDLLAWYDTRAFAPVSLEDLWSNLHRASFDRFEAAVVRGAAPWVWNGIVHVLLRFWAALSLGVLGILFVWAGRRRDDRRRRRR
jgi:hypothetical protein